MSTTCRTSRFTIAAVVLGLALVAVLGVETSPVNATRVVAPSYGWPIKPFFEQHPVRGFFGDPRVGRTPDGISKQFHFGVDVSAPNGTPVYATLTGTARVHPLHPDVVLVDAAGGIEFSYWHVIPAIRPGQRVVAYQTVVGRIEAPWGHVHFSDMRGGRYVDPLRPGGMGPYVDDTKPVIKELEVERQGVQVPLTGVSGRVDLVVETWDTTPVPVPAPWNDMPVMPALVRWRLLSGNAAIRPWEVSVDFRSSIPPASMFDDVFAKWTRQNHPNHAGRYRIFIAHDFDARSLKAGRYRVEIEAEDEAGNATTAAFPLVIS